MPSNPFRSSDEPTLSSVIMVFLPQVPISTNTTPFALIIAIQNSQPVAVHADTPETTPAPLLPSMKRMVVMIALDDLPKATDHNPASTRPTVLHAHAVSVP